MQAKRNVVRRRRPEFELAMAAFDRDTEIGNIGGARIQVVECASHLHCAGLFHLAIAALLHQQHLASVQAG